DTDSDSSSTTLFSSSSAVSDEDDHPNEKDNKSYCIRTKDELPIEELPPVEDLSVILPDNVELKVLGTVSSIIEQLVIIESLRGLPPVNEESIIFKEDRQAAGKIFEIFGPVSHPFYVIRFNSSEHIKERGINVQDSMYFAPSVEDFTQYIFAEKLKQEKGSDASWKNDQEPPPEVLDFSDDEKEREAKEKKKKPQSRGRKKIRSETLPSSENNGLLQSVQRPASSYSRGYCGRGFSFSRDLFPPPSGPRGFFRPNVRPPQLYFSDKRIYQESPVFPPPHRRENPMMQQYAFPPPDFGYASDVHKFYSPPPNMNMMWAGPNIQGNKKISVLDVFRTANTTTVHMMSDIMSFQWLLRPLICNCPPGMKDKRTSFQKVENRLRSLTNGVDNRSAEVHGADDMLIIFLESA
ncbi:H/ACA ribonucleoprotein complex non-core subunit NAF1, partial [Lamprotornis superbus]